MKNYYCDKCGSVDLFIDDRENQKALMCANCGKWIKWISKSELPLLKRFIKNDEITLLKISKLFKDTKKIILLRKNKDGNFKRETLELWEIQDSKYAGSEVIEINYSIELIQSCETTLKITPVLTIYDI
ncbi:MAG: hypothetical protein NSGCLCUN01_03862 [uncultured Clostridium sp.]